MTRDTQGAVESAIDMLRDRMDPNMADLDQAIPQWVFQRAKARARCRFARQSGACVRRGSGHGAPTPRVEIRSLLPLPPACGTLTQRARAVVPYTGCGVHVGL